jgi:hypothetical protein
MRCPSTSQTLVDAIDDSGRNRISDDAVTLAYL